MGDEAKYHPVGAGPFKFVSYQTDVTMKFEKWDGYWQKGKPYLDGLEWVYIKDPVTKMASFTAGEAQVATSVSPKDATNLQGQPDKFKIVSYPDMVFNLVGDAGHPDSPFANIKVRQAMAYAIDNAAIAKAVGFGLFQGTNQCAAPGTNMYNPAVKGYPYNPDKAKQLLTEAGYPNGLDTTVTYDATVPDQASTFQMVQAYFNKVGIRVKLDPAELGRLVELRSKGWHNQLLFFSVATPKGGDPALYFRSLLTSKATLFDPKSVGIPADYDAKFFEAAAEFDIANCYEKFRQLQKMIVDDYCMVVPIMAHYNFNAESINAHLDMSEYGMFEWLPSDAWLSK
jgi:peptide/nickel transport system substrate-binding protein